MMPPRTATGQNFSVHRTGTIQSQGGEGVRPAPYITFDAIVGRNSRFRALNKAQQDELGGVEFRVRLPNSPFLNSFVSDIEHKALSLLWKIVALYWLGFQFLSFTMIAPYLSSSIFKGRFAEDHGVGPVWLVWLCLKLQSAAKQIF